MTEIKLNDTAYQIRTSWNDVTFKDYCEIVKAKGKSFSETVAIFTGIPGITTMHLSLSQLSIICDLVSFMDDPDTVYAFAVSYTSDITIGEQPYWKVEKAKQLLKGNPNPITVAAEIVEMYTGDKDGEGGIDIRNKPVTEVMGMAAFFLTYCQSFLSGSKG